jgi:phosphinothricin acetyltransferase
MSDITIRRAEQDDLPALLEIYNHYVLNTAVTFDVEPVTLAQRQAWLDQFAPHGRYQCFAAIKGKAAIGWVCSARFKEKAAYQTTVETSIYLAPGEGGKGTGRRLYETLFAALTGQDIHRVFAGATLPNPASAALHLSVGFRQAGIQPQVGRKFDRYWDVALFFRGYPQTPSPPGKPLL